MMSITPNFQSGARLDATLLTGLTRKLSAATRILCNEPLAHRTTLRVGGAADLLIEPASEEDLATVVQLGRAQDVPLMVLGRGSNLLVKDSGFHGIVVSLSHQYFSRIEVCSHRLLCGAGARLKAVATEARRRGLGGLEFLETIPGSVGGALRMNAGAMGSAIFDIAETVRFMDFAGHVGERSATEIGAQYRDCPFLRQRLALSVVLVGQPADARLIEQRLNQFNKKRWESQPAAPSAGCIFKNPSHISAGQLIEELGFKGARVGGARVSQEHANFIINDGGATAGDILALIDQIRGKAKEVRGVELETEVQIVGD